MADDKIRVLFLCTKNSARSQMAEALINHDLAARFVAFSAGTEPSTPHPLALRALADEKIDHSGARSKHIDEFADETFDHVISLCDNANENCPVFFGGVNRHHMPFEDPGAATGTEAQQLATFRKVRDQIRDRTERYLITSLRHEKRVVPARKE